MPDYRGLKITVITVSDRAHAGTYEDLTGPLIARMFIEKGADVVRHDLVPDEPELIANAIHGGLSADVVITTGGTGVSPRDVTPDVTKQFLDIELPGIAEAIRSHGAKHTPMAVIGRGVAGFHDRTLVVNLPGSVKAVTESMEVLLPVIPHLIAQRTGKDQH